MTTIHGSSGKDTLTGDGDADFIFAYGGDDHVNAGGGDDYVDLGEGNDLVAAGEGKDQVLGFSGDDLLSGNEGDDKLFGMEDNDLLDGGAGNDSMDGGSGNDFYVVDSFGDTVTEQLSNGLDTVLPFINNYVLPAHVENLHLPEESFHVLSGTGNSLGNTIHGNEYNNTLLGLAGDDFIDGREGNDTLDGGAGSDKLLGSVGDDYLNGRAGADQMLGQWDNDKYVVDHEYDVVIEYASEGVDTVVSTINYALGANVENLTLTESAVRGEGNELSNYILGNALGNTIYAKDGDDTINGRSGDDVLVGGNGKDVIYGDSGADKFRFDSHGQGVDIIRDFNRSEGDKIEIVQSTFGAISLSQFSYNSTTGALFFEHGSPSHPSRVQLATIANKPAGFSIQLDLVLS